jgi:hypothetical protein
MPKGPQGQKRPADVIGNAVKVMRIATGEEEEDVPTGKNPHAVELRCYGRHGARIVSRQANLYARPLANYAVDTERAAK